jgi:hypothetical protein
MFSAETAYDAVRHHTTKQELALRKKTERATTTKLFARLGLLAPTVEDNRVQSGHRSKALGGRERGELLHAVIHAVRLAQRQRDDLVLPASE